ncbi:hypothetical protein DFP72DRAFT_849089 [Ephemerocybe angulata]|uniref:Uncharacterized protein n=1 Tax=Ephemerocybe angulata TaxID=980116 RepID=A0A8H6HX41_9AGAR|nr:hypothetical protein DFP72DRAFT_849089 [Tulosesus angulatus]
MLAIAEQALIDAVNAIVRPIARKGQLHTLSHRLVRTEVEKALGLEEGATSAPEYKKIIKQATEHAMNEEPTEPEEDGGGSSTAVDDLFSSPGSSSKRKRSKSPASSPTRVSARVKKTKPLVISEDEDEDNASEDEYQAESEDEESRTKSKRGRRGSTSKPHKSRATENSDEGSGDEEPSSNGRKKRAGQTLKAKAKKGKDNEPKRSTTKAKNGLQYKTPEHVATSDMEQDEPNEAPRRSPAKPKVQPKANSPKKAKLESVSPAVKRKRKSIAVSDDDGGSGDETEKELKPPSKKKVLATPPRKQKPKDNAELGSLQGSDSETGLSDLIDEPPRRKKGSASKEKTTSKTETKRRTSSSKPALSKDEETIKRLKVRDSTTHSSSHDGDANMEHAMQSFVLACGVRKVWAKLFKDMDTRQQISKLKEMLTELGMTGRLSLEKAKEIKEKREFEKELEDVQQFAKSMQQRESRSGRIKKAQEKDSEPEASEEEEEAVPRRRSGNARNSIAAFLQEQSDSE